jgi:hypothetical protein
VSDKEMRCKMGAAAREHAIRTFDQLRNGERVMEIYDRLLAGRS